MNRDKLGQMNKEEIEDSPYCEICGTCGYLGCCGIRNFISNHIEGKTNCKNEELIIYELENLCDYKDEVFEENKQLKLQLLEKKCSDKDVEYQEKIKLQERIDKAIEYIKENGCYDEEIKLFNDDIWYFELSELLDILEGENNE